VLVNAPLLGGIGVGTVKAVDESRAHNVAKKDCQFLSKSYKIKNFVCQDIFSIKLDKNANFK
jgi:hypothetical protein